MTATSTVEPIAAPSSTTRSARPLVSVLIPAYNHGRYIEECLDSVFDTDYPELELVVIDDCSSDDTLQRAQDWVAAKGSGRFRNVVVRRNEPNQGLVKTLNRLVEASSGEILVLLASDDLLLPQGISLRVDFLLRNPRYLAVFADAKYIDEEGNLICNEFQRIDRKANKKALADPELLPYELIVRWSVPGPVFACRRELYGPKGAGRYDESLRGEDRDMYLRCLAENRLGYIPDEVACYRYVKSSMSSSHTAANHKLMYWYETDRKNLHLFGGLKRALLYLVGTKVLYDIRKDTTGNPVNWVFSKLLAVAIRLSRGAIDLAVLFKRSQS